VSPNGKIIEKEKWDILSPEAQDEMLQKLLDNIK